MRDSIPVVGTAFIDKANDKMRVVGVSHGKMKLKSDACGMAY
jgi:hypothetical protein